MNPNADLCPVCGTPMAIGHYCPQCASDYEEAHYNPNDDFDYMDDPWDDCREQEA